MPRLATHQAMLLLCACGPKPNPEVAQPAAPHSELQCPVGTLPAGMAPPAGTEVWCHRASTNGATWVRHGPTLGWHTNLQKRVEGSYIEGREHGPWLYWFPTGTPQQQGAFAMGVRDGVWTSYHASGERAAEGQYIDGREHGHWIYWSAELLTRTEGEYVLGERDGVWTDFSADERAMRERVYRGGRLISVTGDP